jgi:hypothetical protein
MYQKKWVLGEPSGYKSQKPEIEICKSIHSGE